MIWRALTAICIFVALAFMTSPMLIGSLRASIGTAVQLADLLRLELMSVAFVTALWALYVKDDRLKAHSENVLVALVFLVTSVTITLLGFICSSFESPAWLTSVAQATYLVSCEVLLIACVVIVLWVFRTTYNAVYNLRVDKFVKYFKPVRWVRTTFGPYKQYEVEMLPRRITTPETPLLAACSTDAGGPIGADSGAAVLVKGKVTKRLLSALAQFVANRLEADETVNVVMCDRHPIALWDLLKPQVMQHRRSDIVFIDVYSPTFGFTDDIHVHNHREMEKDGARVVLAKTFAGVHSAMARAFNIIKQAQGRQVSKRRRPCTVIYVSPTALCDVESVEQFKVFWRHVIPSERDYKMLSVIFEHDSGELSSFLSSLVDYVVVANVQGDEASFVCEGQSHEGT
jgi:hypothetical protein